MARPRIHGDRVEWKVRVPLDLAEQIDGLAARSGRDRTATVVAGLRKLLEIRSPETPIPKVSVPQNCPHKYRVQRGSESVCAACGDPR